MCVVLLHTLTSDWHCCSHAHPSCCPPGFSAHPSSKYTPLEKPFEEIPPSPTPHTKNIQPRPPFTPTLAGFSVCLPCHRLRIALMQCDSSLFSPFAPSPPFWCLFLPAWLFCRHGKPAISPPRQPVARPANPADHLDGKVARSGLLACRRAFWAPKDRRRGGDRIPLLPVNAYHFCGSVTKVAISFFWRRETQFMGHLHCFLFEELFSAVIPASLWCSTPGEAYLWPSALSVPPFNR